MDEGNNKSRSKREIAKLITQIENGAELTPPHSEATIVGVTGAPGSGKSTLISAISRALIDKGKKIGVIAVDPSSPISGGAVLGDRIRLNFTHENLFFRSIATRGMRSISKSAYAIAKLLGASGYDVIIIETVGGGQEDYEICAISDLSLLVLCPESGDSIQMLKSGIIELADSIVLNKSDMEGSEIFYTMLKNSFPEKNIFRTVALYGKGVEELTSFMLSWKSAEDHRKEAAIRSFLAMMLKEELFSRFLKESRGVFEENVRAVARREKEIYEAIDDLMRGKDKL